MVGNHENRKKQVVIQETIDQAMAEEFANLLRQNKDDTLLQMVIEGKVTGMDLKTLNNLLERK